ncbi:MAG: hypothetical protein MHMPM18_001061 [Marteilia pararefringens]
MAVYLRTELLMNDDVIDQADRGIIQPIIFLVARHDHCTEIWLNDKLLEPIGKVLISFPLANVCNRPFDELLIYPSDLSTNILVLFRCHRVKRQRTQRAQQLGTIDLLPTYPSDCVKSKSLSSVRHDRTGSFSVNGHINYKSRRYAHSVAPVSLDTKPVLSTLTRQASTAQTDRITHRVGKSREIVRKSGRNIKNSHLASIAGYFRRIIIGIKVSAIFPPNLVA